MGDAQERSDGSRAVQGWSAAEKGLEAEWRWDCVCEKGDRGSGGGWDETRWSARVEDVPAERSVEGETEGETEAGGTARRERLGRTRGGPGEP